MTRGARGHAMGRRGRTIDFKQWSFVPAVGLLVTGNGVFLGASLVFAVPATILRIRGNVILAFTQDVVIGDEMNLTFGMAVVSSDAFTAGAGSMPDPAGEPEFPWLWWSDTFLRQERPVATDSSAWGLSAQRIEIDSKAMRKVKPGESLAMVFQTSASVGAPPVEVDFQRIRVLIGT